MSTPPEFLFAVPGVRQAKHTRRCWSLDSYLVYQRIYKGIQEKYKNYCSWMFGITDLLLVSASSIQFDWNCSRSEATRLLTVFHYVNACNATTGIGQYGRSAGSKGKYQEDDWFFYQVTRTLLEPNASPHVLSSYQNIRISVFHSRHLWAQWHRAWSYNFAQNTNI